MTTDNERLRQLASNADHSVAEAPAVDQRTLHTLLVFRVGSRVFGAPARHVYEVVVSGSITNVPTARPFVVGITLIRGRLVPVISLNELLGIQGGDDTGAMLPRLLILRDGSFEIAVIANSTVGLFEVDVTDLGSSTGPRPDCVAGEVEFRGELVLLLDIPDLVRTVVGEQEQA